MLIFKNIRWKNLLSTGDTFTEIPLNERDSALIIGDNGSGKSTILDALTFGLFGKPFRKINKSQLINSINNKDCVVEIEFDTNGKSYRIVRGIKPNLFEIYSGGVMINQDSSARDYQEHLEKYILKMNYKSFTQIVILGSASFTPFMQLTPADRRVIIEDLLDIQIFSVMSMLVKIKFQTNRENMEKTRISINLKNEKKGVIEHNINGLVSNRDARLKELSERKETLDKELETLQSLLIKQEGRREKMIDEVVDTKAHRDRHRKLIQFQSKMEGNISRIDKEISFYRDNDNCPTCQQEIDDQFKTDSVIKLTSKGATIKEGMVKIKGDISDCVDQITELDKKSNAIAELKSEITSNKNREKHLVDTIQEIYTEIDRMVNSDSLMESNVSALNQVNEELAALEKTRVELIDERRYIDTALNLLKDGGIKTKIIKQYLPIINKLVNKYLTQMGFLINFNINENFLETIKSRYHDVFSYQNFSEGEKMRIDLSLLFAWRAIARMRNSVNTNLLILDEVFDGSLDANGTEDFIKIMKSLVGDVNMFVISHKQEQMVDNFDKIIRFEKYKNYSRMV